MTQEDKDLLVKDLCARLPYGVKVQFGYTITSPAILKGINKDFIECDIAVCELEDIKPYLFPLSSMTEKQRDEYISTCDYQNTYDINNEWIPTLTTFDWCNENHFDYRGLIEKGLAIDCTNLNIY